MENPTEDKTPVLAVVPKRKKSQAANCTKCRWFAPANAERTYGICRRYAPRPEVASTRDEPLGTYWPFVNDQDYCGEFA